MKDNFSKRLRDALNDSDLTQKELSERTGIAQSSISDYLKNRYVPKQDKIDLISQALSIEPAFLLGYNDNKRITGNIIPLIGTIAAGTPILADENIEHYFLIDPSIKADFCLKIKGDSMIDANINNGDIAFIRKQPNLETGEIGAVLIEENATLKRFYQNNGIISLQAANPKYAPILLSDGDVRILGKLVGIYSDRS